MTPALIATYQALLACYRSVRKTDISIFEAMLTPAPNKKERETV